MKLKTKITHVFDIEGDMMDDFNFSVDYIEKPKKKTKIIEVNRKKQIKQDASARLF